MQRRKETTPSRQARGVASNNRHRLPQEEWERKWEEMGPAVIAMAVFLFAFLALGESGVLPC